MPFPVEHVTEVLPRFHECVQYYHHEVPQYTDHFVNGFQGFYQNCHHLVEQHPGRHVAPHNFWFRGLFPKHNFS